MTANRRATLGFVICTERGPLELMSVLFVSTLRRFGGSLANAPVYSYAPRRGKGISQWARTKLEELAVEHCEDILNQSLADYPLANKAFAAAHAERNHRCDFLVFADSDQMVLNAPEALVLEDNYDVALRPVDNKFIGSTGPEDPNHDYWQKLYRMTGATRQSFVHTSVGNERVLAYWNSGLVASRTRSGLFNRWEKNLCRIMKAGLRPKQGLFFVEQSVLAATVEAMELKIFSLPKTYNYPIEAHRALNEALRVDRLCEMHTVHYHHMFETLSLANPLAGFLRDDEPSRILLKELNASRVFAFSPLRRLSGRGGFTRYRRFAKRLAEFLKRRGLGSTPRRPAGHEVEAA